MIMVFMSFKWLLKCVTHLRKLTPTLYKMVEMEQFPDTKGLFQQNNALVMTKK